MHGEVQAQIGYAIKTDGALSAAIDGKTYRCASLTATQDHVAQRPRQTRPVSSQAMKAGQQLVVKSTSARGNNTTYTYSLAGVTAAMDGHRQGVCRH